MKFYVFLFSYIYLISSSNNLSALNYLKGALNYLKELNYYNQINTLTKGRLKNLTKNETIILRIIAVISTIFLLNKFIDLVFPNKSNDENYPVMPNKQLIDQNNIKIGQQHQQRNITDIQNRNINFHLSNQNKSDFEKKNIKNNNNNNNNKNEIIIQKKQINYNKFLCKPGDPHKQIQTSSLEFIDLFLEELIISEIKYEYKQIIFYGCLYFWLPIFLLDLEDKKINYIENKKPQYERFMYKNTKFGFMDLPSLITYATTGKKIFTTEKTLPFINLIDKLKTNNAFGLNLMLDDIYHKDKFISKCRKLSPIKGYLFSSFDQFNETYISKDHDHMKKNFFYKAYNLFVENFFKYKENKEKLETFIKNALCKHNFEGKKKLKNLFEETLSKNEKDKIRPTEKKELNNNFEKLLNETFQNDEYDLQTITILKKLFEKALDGKTLDGKDLLQEKKRFKENCKNLKDNFESFICEKYFLQVEKLKNFEENKNNNNLKIKQTNQNEIPNKENENDQKEKFISEID
jgi:hypothetical protein